MGFICITLAIAIIGGCILAITKGDNDFAVIVTSGGLTFTLFISFIALIEPQVEVFKTNYSETQQVVEIYKNSSIIDHIHEAELCRKMQYINAKIERNRKYAGTFWCGAFTSKEIAAYEKFDIQTELTKNNL